MGVIRPGFTRCGLMPIALNCSVRTICTCRCVLGPSRRPAKDSREGLIYFRVPPSEPGPDSGAEQTPLERGNTPPFDT